MEFQSPTPLQLSPDGILRVPAQSIESGQGKKFLYADAGGETHEVLLARIDGVLFAADSFCPHEGGRLAQGPLMGGRHYFCPLHLYRFEPTTGEAVDVLCPPLRTFSVSEADGEARVVIGPPAPEAGKGAGFPPMG